MHALSWTVRDAWLTIPEWLAKAIRDAFTGALVAITALNLVFPGSVDQAKAEGLLIVSVAIPVVLAVIRVQVVPRVVDWFLGLSQPA